MQEQLYFLDRLEPHNPAYHSPLGLRLSGPLDEIALEQAIGEVVRRHSVLRSRIRWLGGEPMLEALPFEPPQVERVDGPREAADDPLAWALAWATRYTRRSFDLEQGPLYRASLLRLDVRDHLLLVVLHHLATDGWSQQILAREVVDAYAALAVGRRPELPDLPIQYADFARVQRTTLAGAELDREVEYWTRKLAGAPAEIDLPGGRTVGSTRPSSRRLPLPLSVEIAHGLRTLASRLGATPFMVSAAALGTLLCRYDGGELVALAVPFAGRSRPEHQGLIGCFINTLPLPIDLRKDPTVAGLIREVRTNVLEAYDHQEAPLFSIISAMGVERAPGRKPFHQVLINGRNFSFPPREDLPHGLRVQPVRIEPEAPAADLTLGLDSAGQSLRLELEYDASRLDTEFAEEMREHLNTVLAAMLDDPQARIRELPIMSEPQRRRILHAWNRTRTTFPRDASVPSVFADVAARDPEALAVTDRQRRLCYGDLDRLSDLLAARLTALGAGAECPVGIQLPRSAETIVAMLAVLKAGAAYVPLDPTHPAGRRTRILADAGVGLVVGAPGESVVGRRGLPVVSVDMDVLEGTRPVEAMPGPLAAACIMYTSGASGEPKGVSVPHRAILRLVLATDYVRLGPGDVVAHVSNTAFDAATFEVWGALLNGARLVVLDQATVLSPARFAQALRTEKVTTLFLTTAFFNLVSREVPGIFQSLREVLFGGEAVDPVSVRAVLTQGPPARLLHVYGPTEVTTFATWHEVTDVPADAITVPIGQPIANTTAYVLDDRREPVPLKVPGELYLGGDGVALGYVGRSDETRRCFVADPFSTNPEARLYRTGDRVRRRGDGAMEFLGRNDRQIKIRGFRIEPGEIESRLLAHASVAACVIGPWESGHGDRRLAAWVVPRAGQFDASDLRDFLRASLPEYMIPSTFVRLDALPMTANGKVDRRALPDPAGFREGAVDSPSILPEPESTLLEIWREVLDREKIGVNDDFFDDLGGDSLLAVHLFFLVERELGVEMPLETLFRSPTIAQLAEEVRGSWRQLDRALYPLQAHGGAAPLFCIHAAGGHLLMYREFARHMGPDRPVYGFALNRIGNSGELPATVEAMAERYLEELREFRPHGPYHLTGYSFGGLVAWEMACRLEATGAEVGLLAMFDGTRETPAMLSRRERTRRSLLKLRGSLAGNALRLRAEPLAEWPVLAREKLARLRSRWRNWTRRGVEAGRHGDLFAVCRFAHRRYRPGRYGGRLTYFYAEQGFDERKPFIWRGLADGGVRFVAIPARHADLFAAQPAVIAARVRESLEAIDAEFDRYVESATE